MKSSNYTSSHVSIVIPTRNNESDLIDCLISIKSMDYNLKEIEIIIWDNNSQQESKNKVKDFLYRMVEEKTARTAFIEHHRNLGAFNSRDELFKLVSNDAQYILSIDDDVILPPELLKDSLPIFTEDNWVGIIGPRTVFDDAPPETAHGAGFVNWWLGRYTTKDGQAAIECDYVIGCCMLINKQVVDEIGGFDRDYYTSHGEVDFCLRAKKKGFKVVYDPSVIVRHRVDKGGTRNLERLYYVYRNKLLVIKKNWPVPQKWIALFIYSLLWFPKAIIDSVIINKKVNLREIKTIIKAMRDGWSNRFGKRM